MPPKPSETLTEAELRVMEVLWRHGERTVQQLTDALQREGPLAYNSVLTTVRILERKGYAGHRKDGRAHVYRALIGRPEASRSAVRQLVRRFFKSSDELLVLNILEDRGIDRQELERLRQLLENSGAREQNGTRRGPGK